MKRYERIPKIGFILSATVFLMATYIFFTPMAISVERTLRLGHGGDPASAFHQGITPYSDNVAKRTNNRLRIIIYPASQLGGNREMFEAVLLGNLDMASIPASFIASFIPEATMWSFPYLIQDEAYWNRLTRGKIGEKFRKIFERHGATLLSFHSVGFRHTLSKKKVETIEDLKGVRFRIMESPIERITWTTLGAVPTPIPYSEVYMALKLGTVEAMENPLFFMVSMKFYEVTNYLIMTAHSHQTNMIVINKKIFDSLESDLQTILVNESLKGEEYISASVRGGDTEALKFLTAKGKGNLEPIQPDLTPFRKRVGAILTEMTKKFTPETIELIKEAMAGP